MKLAILGGSFNPPHIGHFALAESVLSLGYERVILVPACESPFKQGAGGASPQDRLDMLAASMPADPRLTLDDCEVRRGGVSYTVDTLRDIAGRYYPDGKLGLVIGDDLARDFPKWFNYEEILEMADVVVARRVFGCGETADVPAKLPYPHKTLENAVIPLSSAQVRDKIAKNEPWQYLIPQGARAVIAERGLYSCSPLPVSLTYRMEDAVRALVSPSRFLHSRNVAVLSADLCARFGLDAQKGYLTGIVHDICKSFPNSRLLELAQKDGEKLSKLEKKKPPILHARAGAVFLRENYNIEDEAVLEAVRVHTTGAENMRPLAKVVYIADKIEVTRPTVRPVIREMCQHVPPDMTLDRLFSLILDETVDFLRSRNMDISEGTLKLLDSMGAKRLRFSV